MWFLLLTTIYIIIGILFCSRILFSELLYGSSRGLILLMDISLLATPFELGHCYICTHHCCYHRTGMPWNICVRLAWILVSEAPWKTVISLNIWEFQKIHNPMRSQIKLFKIFDDTLLSYWNTISRPIRIFAYFHHGS